jgi:alkylhydroperoxidase family enzyme
MAHIPPSAIGTTNYERVLGHAPHLLASWSALEDAFSKQSVLNKELLEQVRRTLAESHGCEYCQAKGGPPSPTQAEFKTSLAVGLAQV